jgi:hypothetical protein
MRRVFTHQPDRGFRKAPCQAGPRQVEQGAGSRWVEVMEAGYYQDEKVIASALGFYINTKSGFVW